MCFIYFRAFLNLLNVLYTKPILMGIHRSFVKVFQQLIFWEFYIGTKHNQMNEFNLSVAF